LCHFLDVDYVELGQEDEARAQVATLQQFSPGSSLQSLSERLPFKEQTTADLFTADFRKAGLK
jgi:hypothetical protein